MDEYQGQVWMTIDPNDLDQLLSASHEDLLARLGADVSQLGIRPPSNADLIRAGRRWLTNQRAFLKHAVCRSEQIQRLAASADQHERRVGLVTAIADLLTASLTGLPVITIAVLLVHEGVETLCGDEWPPPEARSADESKKN
jgi:hypothetical protein